MKIKKNKGCKLTFDNGSKIIVKDETTSLAYNYAAFGEIDSLAKTWNFTEPLSFSKEDYGFRFGNRHKMVFVPCYSQQNGWYDANVNVYYNGRLVLEANCDQAK